MTRPRPTVAEVIRSVLDEFLEGDDPGLTPEQRRTLNDLAACRTAALGGHVLGCPDAGISRSPTTPAATATARPARPRPRHGGWRPAPPSCSRCRTSTWSSRCRMPSTRSPWAIPGWSTTCCSAAPPRRCSKWPRTPTTSAPAPACWPCCTPGARPFSSTRTSTAWCRAAGCPRIGRAGSARAPTSSCRCGS